MATDGARSRLGATAGRVAWICFAAVIVLSPFRASFEVVPRSDANVAVVLPWSAVALLATLGFWILGIARTPRRIAIGPRFLSVPVAGLLAVAWVGLPLSVDPPMSAANVVALTLVVALAVYVLNEIDGLERLAVPIMLMIAIQAFVALGQVAAQRSLGLASLGELPLTPGDGGVSIVAAADGTRWLRAYGLTDHPNILGGILAFALVILGSTPGWTGRRRLAGWIVYALGVVTLLLTFSRGAWIAYVVGIVVAITMLSLMRDRPGVRRWLAASVGTLLVCAPLVGPVAPYLAARVNASGPITAERRSIDERLALANGAIEVFLDRPLLGTGLGTLPSVMRLSDPGFDSHQPSHVVLIDAAAETGLLGAVCYLVLVVAPWVVIIRDRARWTAWLVGASAAFAAVTAVGLFDHYTWTALAGLIWAWLALGLWAAAYSATSRGRQHA